MRILVLLAAVAGCASVGGSAQEELAAELRGRVVGPPRACISALQGQSLHPIDERTLVLRAPGTIWVNRLRGDCPGVEPHSTLIVESFSGRYCNGDRVRGVAAGSSAPGPACPIGDFVPYRAPR